MSTKKPSDMLDFLRGDPTVDEVPREEVAPTTRMVVLRRSQVAVAAAVAGLGMILAFVLGLALGGGDAATDRATGKATGGAAMPVWVIRVASYKDTDQGRGIARSVARQLEQLGEVSLQTIPSQGQVVVTLGSWLKDPSRDDEAATALLQRVRTMRDRQGGDRPFASALFWSIQR